MPPAVVAPVFPSASPTCACQSSAAMATPGAPATIASSANCRRCNHMVILLSCGVTIRDLPLVELLRHLFECRSLKQGHLSHRLSVLQLGDDANRAGSGIRIHRRLSDRQQ